MKRYGRRQAAEKNESASGKRQIERDREGRPGREGAVGVVVARDERAWIMLVRTAPGNKPFSEAMRLFVRCSLHLSCPLRATLDCRVITFLGQQSRACKERKNEQSMKKAKGVGRVQMLLLQARSPRTLFTGHVINATHTPSTRTSPR